MEFIICANQIVNNYFVITEQALKENIGRSVVILNECNMEQTIGKARLVWGKDRNGSYGIFCERVLNGGFIIEASSKSFNYCLQPIIKIIETKEVENNTSNNTRELLLVTKCDIMALSLSRYYQE